MHAVGRVFVEGASIYVISQAKMIIVPFAMQTKTKEKKSRQILRNVEGLMKRVEI